MNTSHRTKPTLTVTIGATVVAVVTGLGGGVAAQSTYALQPDDTVTVTVLNQPDLAGRYVVDATGHLQMPLLGPVDVVGLTETALTEVLHGRLSEFFTTPQVTVSVERQRRVFVFGGVTSPGMYELTANMTLIELLARAGYGTASEALIIRTTNGVTPAFPNPASATDVITVNLREFERDLERGRLSRNVVLREGDTVFVPRFDPNRIYVSGQVQNPGAYSVPEGTTVLQALTLAGGPTSEAALNRVRILRVVDGTSQRVDVELDDVVRPMDTVLVPERFF